MALLSALVPECDWEGGSANIDVRVHGALSSPLIEGSAHLSRATMISGLFRHPITNLNAAIKVGHGHPAVMDEGQRSWVVNLLYIWLCVCALCG